MDTQSPRYLRARIDMYRDMLTKIESKEFNAALLRNGVMADGYKEEDIVLAYLKQKDYSNEPLSFTELCTFNTWFALYPEKVCGEQVITTSREFPITIKGDKTFIVNTIQHGTGDKQLIFDLPGDWYIDYFEPSEDFAVDYRCGTYKIQIFSHGVDYNFQIQNGDFLLENINYRYIQDANSHALEFMRAHPSSVSAIATLEIEALALEYELKLRTL